jgi:MFS family permease
MHEETLGARKAHYPILALSAVYVVSDLSRTVNAVLGPALKQDLQLSDTSIGIISATFYLAFLIVQLPLGVMLDRRGIRSVQLAVLPLSAAGAILCAIALNGLTIGLGRLALGIGLSTALMAAFKGVRVWKQIEDVPRWNGLILGIGALGGVLSTWPAGMVSELLGWRFVYFAVALLISLTWIGVFLVVPKKTDSDHARKIDIVQAAKTPVLWQIGVASSLSVGIASAAQSLWAGIWLEDLVGQSSSQTTLLVMSLTTIAGSLGLGAIASLARKRGLSTDVVTLVCILTFCLIQALLIFIAPSSMGLWAAFAAFGTAGMLTFSSIAEKVSSENTATVNAIFNMMTFAAAIFVQVSIGIISDLINPAGANRDENYKWSFFFILLLQVVACLWTPLSRRFDTVLRGKGDGASL